MRCADACRLRRLRFYESNALEPEGPSPSSIFFMGELLQVGLREKGGSGSTRAQTGILALENLCSGFSESHFCELNKQINITSFVSSFTK